MNQFSLKNYCLSILVVVQFFCITSFTHAGYVNFGNYNTGYTSGGVLMYDPYLVGLNTINVYRSMGTYSDFGFPDQASFDNFLNGIYATIVGEYWDGITGNLCLYPTGVGGYYTLPYYECHYDSANSVPSFSNNGVYTIYVSPLYRRNSIHTAWTDKATYQPGEPVYVTGEATRNDLFVVTVNAGISTSPGCSGSNGCSGTELYTYAPSTPGTYSIPVTGCWYTGWWCTTSYGLTFDVVATPVVNINFQ